MTDKGMIRDFSLPVSYSVTTAEITFSATGSGLINSIELNGRYYFEPYDTLNYNNSKIHAIEVVSTTFQSVYTDGTSSLSSDDVFGNFVLHLIDNEDKDLVQVPLTSLLGVAYQGDARKLYQLNLGNVVWSNCYIELTGNPLLISAGQSIKFNIYYDELDFKTN